MRKFFVSAAVVIAALASGCTRIETGEVGVRLNASKQIEGNELLPGSFNQDLVGSILTFPVKDISVLIDNKTPMAADNSALDDFDMTIVYAISPASVAELYSTKSRSFHATFEEDILLMYNYIGTLANNAAYKVIRKYPSLEVADNRAKIETEIRDTVTEQLKSEKLDTAITLTVVQVRSILPNKAILASATEYVKAQNDLKIKTTEVEIAKKESERMAALSNNSTASIAFMNAQAALNISEGVKNGKVQTIIIPSTMTGLMIGK